MSTSTKSLSESYMGERFGVTEKTARLFLHKAREAMKSSKSHPIKGGVQLDKFVAVGKEKGTVGKSYHSKNKKLVVTV